MEDTFLNTKINLVVCTTDQFLISLIEENNCLNIDCSENWGNKRKRIIVENNTCVDNCSLVQNTFEYDFKCYRDCPFGNFKYIYLSLIHI